MKKYSDFLVMMVLLGSMFMFSFKPTRRNVANTNAESTEFRSLSVPDSLFRSGDLIFRDGRGVISSVFRKLSLNDPRYSHAGIIHIERQNVFVYHIIGGQEGTNNKMRKELLESFCSPAQSNAYAVYRTDQNGLRIDSMATCYYLNAIEFDDAFNLATDDKMYCTELVYKILTKVSGKNNFLPLTDFSGVKYLACDNIYLSSHVVKIYSN